MKVSRVIFEVLSVNVFVAQSYFEKNFQQQMIIPYENSHLWSRDCRFQSSIRNYIFSLNCCLLLTNSVKVDVSLPLTTVLSPFCRHSLFFVGFTFPVSFDTGDISSQLVSAHVMHYCFEDESGLSY